MRRPETIARLAVTTFVLFASALSLPPSAVAKPPRRPPPAATTGTLAIFSFAPGAEVEVDGTVVGKTPLSEPLKLAPGSHTVRVFLRGFTEFNETVDVKAGETTEVEADLIAFAGIVQIQANFPGATVAIDGKLAGTVPFDKDIPAGKHEIVVQAPGKLPFKQVVDVVAGKPLALTATLADIPEIAPPGGGIHTKWWFWTVIGVVVAGGAATGIALGLKSGTTTDAPFDEEWRLP